MSARRLPLFPLPLVLFPGASLPLHIFEPRYRQLLADCLAGDGRFGILFRPESMPEHSLPAGHVGCVAQVRDSEVLPDGRSNVLVVGVERFAFERFVDSDRLYHIGEVSPYKDEPESSLATETLAERVRGVFVRVARAARALTDDPDPIPTLPADPALLSFSIASLIDLDAPARQTLLASRSPTQRLRELDALLSGAVDSIEQRAVVHARAKSNGHGPHAEG